MRMCDLSKLPPELLSKILDGPDGARWHMIRLGQDAAREQASRGPLGWATWAEQFVPFLIGTEDPYRIYQFVLVVWSWLHRHGLNPWLRTRQNAYTDLRRAPYYPPGYGPRNWPLAHRPYVRRIRRGGADGHTFELHDRRDREPRQFDINYDQQDRT